MYMYIMYIRIYIHVCVCIYIYIIEYTHAHLLHFFLPIFRHFGQVAKRNVDGLPELPLARWEDAP